MLGPLSSATECARMSTRARAKPTRLPQRKEFTQANGVFVAGSSRPPRAQRDWEWVEARPWARERRKDNCENKAHFGRGKPVCGLFFARAPEGPLRPARLSTLARPRACFDSSFVRPRACFDTRFPTASVPSK